MSTFRCLPSSSLLPLSPSPCLTVGACSWLVAEDGSLVSVVWLMNTQAHTHVHVVMAASCNTPFKGLGAPTTGLLVWAGVEGSCFSPDIHPFPQDHCGSNPGTFRVLVGNEGCSVPSLKCRKRITILVEGGEIELFDGEVSMGWCPTLSAPIS